MNSAPNSMGSGLDGSCMVKIRPPSRPRGSTRTAVFPAWDSSRAAASPAAPPPRITASTPRFMDCYFFPREWRTRLPATGNRQHLLQHRRLLQDVSFGETLQAQRGNIQTVGFAMQDQFGD